MDKNEQKKLVIAMLMELKASRKMLEFSFKNNFDKLPEKTINALLDEKNRIEKQIEAYEKLLKELEK